MGLKKFINNIRYLMRYNLKTMLNDIENSINYTDCINFLHMIPNVKTKSNNILQFKNIEETINILLHNNQSLVRYGDGEFNIIKGISIPFQNYDKDLAKKLKEILCNHKDNILVGIPYFYFNIELYKYNQPIYEFIIQYVMKELNYIHSMLSNNMVYLSTEVTQLYQIYKEYDFETYFNKIRKIWENKEIVIVCGETVFNNIEYNIFENSKSIDYIYAPSKNAYDKYSEILKQSLQYDKNKLFIIILGPTANILAYDLANNGYRALDLGHIAKDYDAYMKKIERNHKNIMNFFKPD